MAASFAILSSRWMTPQSPDWCRVSTLFRPLGPRARKATAVVATRPSENRGFIRIATTNPVKGYCIGCQQSGLGRGGPGGTGRVPRRLCSIGPVDHCIFSSQRTLFLSTKSPTAPAICLLCKPERSRLCHEDDLVDGLLAIAVARARILGRFNPDGFNIGINVGRAAVGDRAGQAREGLGRLQNGDERAWDPEACHERDREKVLSRVHPSCLAVGSSLALRPNVHSLWIVFSSEIRLSGLVMGDSFA
jgi:hypothetical protein